LTEQAQLCLGKRNGTCLAALPIDGENFAGLAGAGGPKARRVTRRYLGNLLHLPIAICCCQDWQK